MITAVFHSSGTNATEKKQLIVNNAKWLDNTFLNPLEKCRRELISPNVQLFFNFLMVVEILDSFMSILSKQSAVLLLHCGSKTLSR